MEPQRNASGDAPTPLPMKKLAVMVIILLNDAISMTMLFPFVGLLVAHLDPHVNTNSAGYLSGFLVGVFQLAQVISGKPWGRASDIAGRKPVLECGLLLSALVMLLFGLSGSVAAAAVFRFLHGLSNGNCAVGKTVVGEITDETNESKGFAIISVSWGIGTIIGPGIGGMLYDPCNGHGIFSKIGLEAPSCNSIWGSHPALLPCVVGCCYSLFAFVISRCFLEETSTRAQGLVACVRHFLSSPKKGKVTTSSGSSPTAPIVENFPTPQPGTEIETTSSVVAIPPSTPIDGSNDTASCDQEEAPPLPQQRLSTRDIFTDPQMRTAIFLYMIICGGDIIFWETFPLWAIASKNVGGLHTNAGTIGFIIMLSGIPTIIANFTFHFVVEKAPSRLWLWKFCMSIWAAMTLLIPTTSSLHSMDSSFTVLALILFIRQTVESWAYFLCFLFIARAAPVEHLGTMNGVAHSSGALIRTFLPMIAAPLFAISVSSDSGNNILLNHYTVFIVGALCFLGGYAIACCGAFPINRVVDGCHEGSTSVQQANEGTKLDKGALVEVFEMHAVAPPAALRSPSNAVCNASMTSLSSQKTAEEQRRGDNMVMGVPFCNDHHIIVESRHRESTLDLSEAVAMPQHQ